MPSPDNGELSLAVRKTVWLLCAVAISALEFFIPRLPFFPWLKPGLANVVTLVWIIEFGTADAVLFSLLRTWIVGFYFGFSFVSLMLSASGAMFATLVMGILWSSLGKRGLLGTLGVSIVGALCHNLGQLLAVYALLTANTRLFYQVPVMIAASLLFGGIVGLLVPFTRKVLTESVAVAKTSILDTRTRPRVSTSDSLFSLLLLAASVAVMFVGPWQALAACAGVATAAVQIFHKGSLRALLRPVTTGWVLFLFIIAVNLFMSYGIRYEQCPLITYEGVALAVKQSLRLWTWLQISALFPYFNFTGVLFSLMNRVFSRHQSTLHAGLLSLEYFPAAAQEGKRHAKGMLRSLLRKRSGKSDERMGIKGLILDLAAGVQASISGGATGDHR